MQVGAPHLANSNRGIGIVQATGFRSTVWWLADRCDIVGQVIPGWE